MKIDREAFLNRVRDTMLNGKFPEFQEGIINELLDNVEASSLTQGDEYLIAQYLSSTWSRNSFRLIPKNQAFYRILGALNFVN